MKDDAIFINCPFDDGYLPLLRAMLFVARFYGLEIKIASSDLDSKSNRLARIIALMKESKYSVHDLSKMKSNQEGEYYRMNMPFELGLDYGIGGDEKVFLIFENEPYKLKIALSDINGWDVRPHLDKPETLVMEFRRWIVVNRDLPPTLKSFSSSDIWYKYNDFYGSFSDYMTIHHMKDEEISISEYLEFIDKYLVDTSIS
jgi:hypothetical protein